MSKLVEFLFFMYVKLKLSSFGGRKEERKKVYYNQTKLFLDHCRPSTFSMFLITRKKCPKMIERAGCKKFRPLFFWLIPKQWHIYIELSKTPP